MSSSKTFTLVKGSYSPDDAKEILMNLIQSKIQFHNIRKLSSFEKSGSRDEKSEDRISDLKETRKEILEILKSSDEKGISNVIINSTIHITLE